MDVVNAHLHQKKYQISLRIKPPISAQETSKHTYQNRSPSAIQISILDGLVSTISPIDTFVYEIKCQSVRPGHVTKNQALAVPAIHISSFDARSCSPVRPVHVSSWNNIILKWYLLYYLKKQRFFRYSIFSFTCWIHNDVSWLVDIVPHKQCSHAAVSVRHFNSVCSSVSPVEFVGVPIECQSSWPT